MLDLVGPLEVFKFAPEYEVAVASPEGHNGIAIESWIQNLGCRSLHKAAGSDRYTSGCGGPGANDELYDDEYLHRIIGLASRSRRVAAICYRNVRARSRWTA